MTVSIEHMLGSAGIELGSIPSVATCMLVRLVSSGLMYCTSVQYVTQGPASHCEPSFTGVSSVMSSLKSFISQYCLYISFYF